MRHIRHCAVAVGLALLAGCTGDKPLPPVFNAVFGLSTAQSNPYAVGRIDERAPGPSDTVVGSAANGAGDCIWEGDEARRFRAACPEGYRPAR
jgi:hypothetical protein